MTLACFGIGCLVFLAATAYDVAWAKYFRAAATGKALQAAAWSVVVYAIGLVGLVGVLKISGWLILPEAAGLFVGTSIGVSLNRDVD